jgi:hypothetical protein
MDSLESLRSLINSSIDIVQKDLRDHDDPPLELMTPVRHPQRDRYNAKVNRALKCISSASFMLKALCDPEGLMHDIMFNVRNRSVASFLLKNGGPKTHVDFENSFMI